MRNRRGGTTFRRTLTKMDHGFHWMLRSNENVSISLSRLGSLSRRFTETEVLCVFVWVLCLFCVWLWVFVPLNGSRRIPYEDRGWSQKATSWRNKTKGYTKVNALIGCPNDQTAGKGRMQSYAHEYLQQLWNVNMGKSVVECGFGMVNQFGKWYK